MLQNKLVACIGASAANCECARELTTQILVNEFTQFYLTNILELRLRKVFYKSQNLRHFKKK